MPSHPQNLWFQRSGKALVFLALFSVLGGNWVVFQSIAWAKMIHERAEDRTIVDSVVATFSGLEPCELCVAIHEGKLKEKSPDSATSKLVKPVLGPLPRNRFKVLKPAVVAVFHEGRGPLRSVLPDPPTPPPRVAPVV